MFLYMQVGLTQIHPCSCCGRIRKSQATILYAGTPLSPQKWHQFFSGSNLMFISVLDSAPGVADITHSPTVSGTELWLTSCSFLTSVMLVNSCWSHLFSYCSPVTAPRLLPRPSTGSHSTQSTCVERSQLRRE